VDRKMPAREQSTRQSHGSHLDIGFSHFRFYARRKSLETKLCATFNQLFIYLYYVAFN